MYIMYIFYSHNNTVLQTKCTSSIGCAYVNGARSYCRFKWFNSFLTDDILRQYTKLKTIH